MSKKIVPAEFQSPLPLEKLLLRTAPDEESVPMDVVFVGGGPAGLAGAIRLAQRVKDDPDLGEVEIAVLEKAEELGQHSLSGAVVNPRAFRELFPDMEEKDFPLRVPVEGEKVYILTEKASWRIPTPPPMHNAGNYTASISEIVTWLGAKAEELGINVFTGFPAEALLLDDGKVVGVRTTATGLNRDSEPGAGYQPPTDITARVVVLADGCRGSLSQAWLESQNANRENPQSYALGVKEIWETKKPLPDVIHTMGWPLPRDAFGGSFVYPLGDNLVALGLVVGLDYRQTTLDVHILTQRLKQHPILKDLLEGGEMVEWGAKTIPEGGYFALPDRFSGDGVLVLGDSLGLVDVPSLKGIHYAMQSGIEAANVIADALAKDDVSAATLHAYDERIRKSYILKDMKRTRNMRLAFKSGFFMGSFKSAMMVVSGGIFPGGKIDMEDDADVPKTVTPPPEFTADNVLTFSKMDAVYKSGNLTRDDIPSHLVLGKDIDGDVADFYTAMCPAGVYEREGDKLVVNPPNCIDCKATDVLGPRWTPREGGSGPKYKRM